MSTEIFKVEIQDWELFDILLDSDYPETDNVLELTTIPVVVQTSKGERTHHFSLEELLDEADAIGLIEDYDEESVTFEVCLEDNTTRYVLQTMGIGTVEEDEFNDILVMAARSKVQRILDFQDECNLMDNVLHGFVDIFSPKSV